jgi:hypothetical protein
VRCTAYGFSAIKKIAEHFSSLVLLVSISDIEKQPRIVRTYAKFLALEPSLSSWGSRYRRQSSAWSLRGSLSTLSAQLPRALPAIQNEREDADISRVSRRMFVESKYCLSVLKEFGTDRTCAASLVGGANKKELQSGISCARRPSIRDSRAILGEFRYPNADEHARCLAAGDTSQLGS